MWAHEDAWGNSTSLLGRLQSLEEKNVAGSGYTQDMRRASLRLRGSSLSPFSDASHEENERTAEALATCKRFITQLWTYPRSRYAFAPLLRHSCPHFAHAHICFSLCRTGVGMKVLNLSSHPYRPKRCSARSAIKIGPGSDARAANSSSPMMERTSRDLAT